MNAPKTIPFNQVRPVGREYQYMQEAVDLHHLSSGGRFAGQCEEWLERRLGTPRAILTHTCTHALELACLAIDLKPGDEVIMPSFAFVTAATAIALRGAVPVFVDISPDSLTLHPDTVARAITDRTKAVIVIHYAGYGAWVDGLREVCDRNGIHLIEDAAQAIDSSYLGRPLGTFGHLATLSFHETKNLIAGEGGALLINDAALIDRIEIMAEKGTDRAQFLQGRVEKYVWQDLGSSVRMGELPAAYLFAQFEEADHVFGYRRELWRRYHAGLTPMANEKGLSLPRHIPDSSGNAHLFYVLTRDRAHRDRLLSHLADHGVQSVFHYVPLHSSPAGQKFGRAHGPLTVTDQVADTLLRLPLYHSLSFDDVARVVEAVAAFEPPERDAP
ncbi:MAG: dTDP-4-amino-4,6-dideoxygalactose transaminase [Alphaproteobacteria bacterium]|nr:dTDP-4-amino-4,6-dideoxygalactose transaminase [Alphaproteobacteria bacterium]